MGSALHYCHGGLGDTILGLGVHSAPHLSVGPSLSRKRIEKGVPFIAFGKIASSSPFPTFREALHRPRSNTMAILRQSSMANITGHFSLGSNYPCEPEND